MNKKRQCIEIYRLKLLFEGGNLLLLPAAVSFDASSFIKARLFIFCLRCCTNVRFFFFFHRKKFTVLALFYEIELTRINNRNNLE